MALWTRRLALATLALAAAGCAVTTVGEASGAPAVTVPIVAEGNAFHPSRTELPSDSVVAIALENRDPGILHNIAIYPARGGEPLFRGPTFAGIATSTYTIAPLPNGIFRFVCDVHPGMEGELVVGPAER